MTTRPSQPNEPKETPGAALMVAVLFGFALLVIILNNLIPRY